MLTTMRQKSPRPSIAALTAVLLCVLLAPTGAEAKKKKKPEKEEEVALEAVVLNQAGEVLTGVMVGVSADSGSDFAAETTTGKEGEFAMELPGAGDYTLRLVKDGYTPFEQSLRFEAGERQSVRVEMLDASVGRRSEAVKAYNAGADAYEARDLDQAKEHFLAATQADASLPEPFLVLADIYLSQETPAEAAAAIEKFLELVPGDRKGQMLAYEAYQKLGDQAKIAAYREILGGDAELAPKLAIQAYNEGAMANQKGDVESAIEKFRAALDLDPNLVEAHAALATVYYNLERFDEAVASVDKALELKPEHKAASRVRYLIHDARHDQQAAKAAIESYSKIDPQGAASLLYQRADLDFRAGETALASAALLEVLELAPEMARAHYTLGLIYSSTDTAKAKVHLKKFIEMAPDDPEVASAKEMLSYF